jgi:hypothetical protein
MRRRSSNWLLYFLVVLGLAGPIALGAWVWWFVRGEPAGPLVAIASLFIARGDEAGVAELRGIGCEGVFVTMPGELPEGVREEDERGDRHGTPSVSCTSYAGRVPTCDEVARTYAPYLPDPQEAAVWVTSRGTPVCSGRYTASGAHLGSTLGGAIAGTDPT